MSSISQFWGRFSVGNKIAIAAGSIILVVFSVVMLCIIPYADRSIREKAEQNIASEVSHIVESLKVFSVTAKESVANATLYFQSMYPGAWSVDHTREIQIGDYRIASLMNNGKQASLDNKGPDEFARNLKGGAATILYRLPDGDYLRTATSLMKQDGTRSAGTLLGKDHPAIPFLEKGEEYVGPARLLGKEYFAKYTPIKADGKVVGAIFVGVLLDEQMKEIKKDILARRFGETGYVYVLDMKGILQIHPSLEGKEMLDVKDINGHLFIREILEKKNGVIVYPWMNKGETKPREKIVVYQHFGSWNWVIAGGVYIDELGTEKWAVLKLLALLGFGIALVITIAILVLVRKLLSPLVDMVAIAETVASGRLDVSIPVSDHGDEVGRLNRAFVSMLTSLRGMVIKIQSSAEKVSSTAGQIAVSSGELNKSSIGQSEATSSMAAAVEELTVSIGQIAENAEHAGVISREVSGLVVRDAETVASMNAGMNDIVVNMERSYQEVGELSDLSSKIGGIVQVIKDVADQTNLLALNAAIEAARAGEQGRGFAVVADEVRKLAERTGKATGEISGVIKSMQTGVGTANRTIQTGKARVAAGSEQTILVGEALKRIEKGTSQTNDGVQAIIDATREQSAAANDIARNVEHIASTAEQNSVAIRQTAESADHLSHLAEDLKQVANMFQV